MDEIDRLLSNLTPDATQKFPNPEVKAFLTSAARSTTGSIDQLLERLGEPQKQQVWDALLESSRSTHPSVFTTPVAIPSSIPQKTVPELQAYATEQTAIAQAEQQATIAKAKHQEQLKQQRQQELRSKRQQELRSQAQHWLDHLDIKSPEGRWFEEFGCHYDSQLEAAIAYLEALQEVDRFLG
jgi:hypothetical protein